MNPNSPLTASILPAHIATLPAVGKMLDRRVRSGNNAEQSRELLAELIGSHSGVRLAHALCYQGFATEAQAHRFATEYEGAADHLVNPVTPSSPTE